jgi:hypothetical protein
LPAALESLALTELSFEFATKSKDYKICGKGEIKINGVDVKSEIHIQAKHQDGAAQTAFSGRLLVAEKYFFDVIFGKDGEAGSILVAAYHDEGNKHLQLGDLLQEFGIDPAPSLNVQVKDAFLVSGDFSDADSTNEKNNLFVSDIEGGINLSKLPLVGELFHGDKSVRLAFHVQWAQDVFDQKAVGTINAALPEGIPHLDENKKGLPKDLGLAISMELGTEIIPIEFPLTAKENPDQSATGQRDEETTSVPEANPVIVPDTEKPRETDIKWFTVQKSIGPVHFRRVGVSYKSELFTFTIDASLSMGGLTLSLDGLSASSPLQKFDPTFDLKGLGLEFENGPVEIGGAFLRETAGGHDEYSGMAILKTEALSLMAMGSYTRIHGHPSLFLYAILNKPIGGPTFFFVEGLAAGFGYNRQLIIPAVDKVATFPLVEAAISGQVPETIDPAVELQKLRAYIPPSVGDIFLAIGVKFNSFKQIDSFALLTLPIGHRFELQLLGLSNLVVPSVIPEGQSPLARIEMALAATFIPEEGFLGVQAQLTSNSYILSKACKLTGGFAFFSWFAGSHEGESLEGDFVATLGGYHPEFKVPGHYPQHLPLLNFNWIVDPSTTIKGEAYYALCSHAFMVGGHLEASYHSGPLSASFKAGADFLIAWKPYHYDAHIYVDLNASYTYHFFGTHHITADISADIHLSGPEFGGTATIHIWVVSKTVSFGAGTGAPKAIEWNEFKKSFLPKEEAIISVTLNHGLISEPKEVSKAKKGDPKVVNLGVVNPKKFKLTIESVIPSNKILCNNKSFSGPGFGIGSMGVKENLTSNQTITITGPAGDIDLNVTPLEKKAPTGLWGTKLKPGVNEERYIEDALMGVEISLDFPPKDGPTEPVSGTDLMIDPLEIENSFAWEDQLDFQKAGQSIIKDKVNSDIISALGMTGQVAWDRFNADDYLFAKQ